MDAGGVIVYYVDGAGVKEHADFVGAGEGGNAGADLFQQGCELAQFQLAVAEGGGVVPPKGQEGDGVVINQFQGGGQHIVVEPAAFQVVEEELGGDSFPEARRGRPVLLRWHTTVSLILEGGEAVEQISVESEIFWVAEAVGGKLGAHDCGESEYGALVEAASVFSDSRRVVRMSGAMLWLREGTRPP
jgi:hypothetical protein